MPQKLLGKNPAASGITKNKSNNNNPKRKSAPLKRKLAPIRFDVKSTRKFHQTIEDKMAAKVLRAEGNSFLLSELNSSGKHQVSVEDAKRQHKLEKAKRRANAKDGFEASLRKAEKRLKEAIES
jgi:hypothetical protein